MIKSTIANDQIDIYLHPEVNLQQLKPLNNRDFRVDLMGQSVDYSIVNAIRRTIMMDIPVWAFTRSQTVVDARSYNMYNNDMIFNQIETLPIFDIVNHLDLVNPELYLSKTVHHKLFGDFANLPLPILEEEPDVPKENTHIELFIDYQNETDTDHFLNTHDVVLKVNGSVVKSYLAREPICLLVLKPKESLILRSVAKLGISRIHAAYEATTNAIHQELSPTHYRLWYETLEQLPGNFIFSKACMFLYKKLRLLRTFIDATYTEQSVNDEIEIQLFGADHTLGNLISTILQKCEYVKAAGYCMPHPFIDNVVISYRLFTTANKEPIAILKDCITYLIKLFRKIYKLSVQ